MKANSDVKHAKSQLAAENKKKKALEKSLSDVRGVVTNSKSN